MICSLASYIKIEQIKKISVYPVLTGTLIKVAHYTFKTFLKSAEKVSIMKDSMMQNKYINQIGKNKQFLGGKMTLKFKSINMNKCLRRI